jgi:hypothetical protein
MRESASSFGTRARASELESKALSPQIRREEDEALWVYSVSMEIKHECPET